MKLLPNISRCLPTNGGNSDDNKQKTSLRKFFHQLRLLLWKNFIIKKRSLFVLLFELTVPLVLFLILVGIRQKKFAIPIDIEYFEAWPLPSAGFVPIMQSFCNEDSGVTNEHGIVEYPNSTAKDMLEQIDKITRAPWSSKWFARSYTLNQLFERSPPTNNINQLSDLLAQVLKLDDTKTPRSSSSSSSQAKLNDSMLDDLELKLTDYIHFKQALDDLSKLSVHFPRGLCGPSRDSAAEHIMEEGDRMRTQRKPESLINAADAPIDGHNEPSAKFKQSLMRNWGFVGLWLNMQKTFCGVEPTKVIKNSTSTSTKSTTTTTTAAPKTSTTTTATNATSSTDEEPQVSEFDGDLNLSKTQLQSLSLIFHVLYSNPLILYSPNTTLVHDNLIRKSNTTFELIDRINQFCRQWLDASGKLVDYLTHDKRTNVSLTELNAIHEQINGSATTITTTTTTTTTTTSKTTEKLTTLSANDLLQRLNGENATKVASVLELLALLPNSTSQDLVDKIDMIDSAACSWLKIMSGVNLNVFRGFASEDDLVDYFLNRAYFDNVTVIASIVFQLPVENSTNGEKLKQLHPHMTYKIRQNASFTINTKKIRDRYWFPSPRNWGYSYYIFGFVWLQDLIDRAIIDYHANASVLEPGTYLHEMPYPCYLSDDFLQMIEHVMPLCLSISFVYTVAMLSQTIVYEKELRLKEVMKIMGLNNLVHWLAWFITYFVQFTLIMALVTLLLHYGNILMHSDPLLIFFLLEIYAIATISFSFLVSSLYSKAKLAAACAGIMYFLSYVPCMYISIREDVAFEIMPWSTKILASLFSTSAFGIGSKYIAFYENDGLGLQWHNIGESPVENDTYNCLMSVKIMILDCFLYWMLAWYIENVNPSFGIPLPWYYPLKPSYWLGKSISFADSNSIDTAHITTTTTAAAATSLRRQTSLRRKSSAARKLLAPFVWLKSLLPVANESLSYTEPEQAKYINAGARRNRRANNAMPSVNANSVLFEAEPLNLTVGVSIHNLTKRYGRVDKLAVNNLSLNFYESQITSFLGHNGAGKTTTMNMLTGLLPVTSGTAYIYGRDIRTEINAIRNNMGWCPQHNVLFDKLTVEEHMWFYAKLKHMNDHSIDKLIKNMLHDTGLKKKRNNMVNTLSGGMQRKLSVAIAFVGDANLVILDEPTAGVDPYARRAIWDLLLKYKQGRTIILSTHHMDEAELLGDRIAIIYDGQLQCCGTSLFLKNALGEGNHLTLVKNERQVLADELLKTDESTVASETLAKKNSERVLEFLRAFVPSVCLKEETIREYHFVIPLSERAKPKFWQLFQALDEYRHALGIDSYGIHDVSLEEVFIKATQIKSNRIAAAARQQEAEEEEEEEEDDEEENDNAENDEELLVDNSHHKSASSLAYSSSSSSECSSRRHRAKATAAAASSSSTISSAGSSSTATMTSSSIKSLYNLDFVYADLESGYRLLFKQLTATIIKRYLYNKRNWKSLLTQIILPACFICIAMTVALSAPGFPDLPPLELSSSQFYPLTKPEGTYVPYAYSLGDEDNEPAVKQSTANFESASSYEIVRTLHQLVGLGSECTLKQRENITLSDLFSRDDGSLLRKYFGPAQNNESCEIVFNANADVDFEYLELSSKAHTAWKKKRGDVANYYPNCVCLKDMIGFECSSLADLDKPPEFRTLTREILLNISVRHAEATKGHESKYYLYTTDMFRLKRYGGLSFDNEKTWPPASKKKAEPLQQQDPDSLLRKLSTKRKSSVWYNNKGFHAMPTFLNVMNNALLRANVRKSLEQQQQRQMTPREALLRAQSYGITVINHPMNQTNNYLSTEYLLQGSDVIISIFTIVAMSFVNASFVLFLVYERGIKSLHLQFLIGLNPLLYWCTNFVWDLLNYLLPASCVIIILKVFNVPAYVEGNNFPAVISLFLLYGWSVSPLMYPASFLFSEPSSAYIFLIVLNLFVGITCVESSFLFQVFSFDKDFSVLYDSIKSVFLAFPPYCLGRGLIDIAYNDYYNSFYAKTGQLNKIRSPFEWDITTSKLVSMAIVGLVSWIFTLLLEYEFFRFKWCRCLFGRKPVSHDFIVDDNSIDDDESSAIIKQQQHFQPHLHHHHHQHHNEDPDVRLERQRVEANLRRGGGADQLILRGLRKVYAANTYSGYNLRMRCCGGGAGGGESGEFVAVKDLTFGVPRGECFGLLGVNGAGKTTTFKMLTTDHEPSAGDIFLRKLVAEQTTRLLSPSLSLHSYWQEIGYCPQFDALYDELTPADHLRLFARLKGVRARYEPFLCDALLKRLDLTRYADKPVGSLSLGNKRKLSTALALVGNPSVVLLDEPTSAMDPVARRQLWEEILNLTRHKNRSVVLTSHSMEECEVLCTRLAIMAEGRFKCLGSVQHLKTRFGDGYTLTVKIREMKKLHHYLYEDDYQDQEDEDDDENNANATSLNSSASSTAATLSSPPKPCKNKYINLILRELKEHISERCKLKERHFNNVYQFELPTSIEPALNIGNVFRLIESNKLRFNIADYSLSQNTLDNVFINFVKEQNKNKRRRRDSDDHDRNQSDLEDTGNDKQGSSGLQDQSQQQPFDVTLETGGGGGGTASIFPIHDNDELLLNVSGENFIDLTATTNRTPVSSNKSSPTTAVKKSSSDINEGASSLQLLNTKNNKRHFDHRLENTEIFEEDYC